MKKKYKNSKGISLIEVIVSIALIGIISISILPLFVFSNKTNKTNEIKMNALNLAYSQMEWIKGKKYEDIEIAENETEIEKIFKDKYMNEDENPVINNIEYIVRTNVSWEKANSITDGKIVSALKKVDVAVYAIDIFENEEKEHVAIDTLITYERARDYELLEYIKVFTYLENNSTPMKYVKVKLQPNGEIRYTDKDGSVIFGKLQSGQYIISPREWELSEVIFKPTRVEDNEYITERNITIEEKEENEPIEFIGEKPAYLKILNTHYPNYTINLWPNDETIGESMRVQNKLSDLEKRKLWRRWTYTYEISNGENKYYLSDEKLENEWDGKFQLPNDKKSVDRVYLSVYMNENTNLFKQKIDNKDIYIAEINFSSPLGDFDDMEFKINDDIINENYQKLEELCFSNVNKKAYYIEKLDEVDGLSKKIKIYLYCNGEFLNTGSQLEIINPQELKDNFGITLAPYKSKTVLELN